MSLKQQLSSGSTTIGSWIQLGHEALVEMMATASFDWLCIDLEHTTISIEQFGRIVRVADLAGTPVLARLSGHDPGQVKRVLDAGAVGIVAPMITTPEQAAAIVAAATYPPRGDRGVGLARAQRYGLGFAEYFERIGRELICIMQVEHIDGVENLDAILAVDGVDGFFIGPYDLSASLGRPGEFDHPDVVAALDRVAEVIRRPDVLAGIHVVEPDIERLQKVIENGYRFVAFASDMLLFAHRLADLAPSIDGAREGTQC